MTTDGERRKHAHDRDRTGRSGRGDSGNRGGRPGADPRGVDDRPRRALRRKVVNSADRGPSPSRSDEQHLRESELGQHFIEGEATVKILTKGLRLDDVHVLDIGAGAGVITAALAPFARRVTAIEIDQRWVTYLRQRFDTADNVDIVAQAFADYSLPVDDYLVVANLPFGSTTEILAKLLRPPSGLVIGRVIVEDAVASKRASRKSMTLLSACWYPWFKIRADEKIPRRYFSPPPGVDGRILTVRRRSEPLLDASAFSVYESFLRRLYASPPQGGTELALSDILGIRRASRLLDELNVPADRAVSSLGGDDLVALFKASGAPDR